MSTRFWSILDLVGTVLFILAMIGSWAFVGLYALRSNWRATEAGRVLFGYMVVVSSIMLVAVILGLLHIGSEEIVTALRVIFYGALLACTIALNRVLWRSQQRRREAQQCREQEHLSGIGKPESSGLTLENGS